MCSSDLAGLAIVLGIPFPIWIYFKGEEMRARNPLTQKSATVAKKKPSFRHETQETQETVQETVEQAEQQEAEQET